MTRVKPSSAPERLSSIRSTRKAHPRPICHPLHGIAWTLPHPHNPCEPPSGAFYGKPRAAARLRLNKNASPHGRVEREPANQSGGGARRQYGWSAALHCCAEITHGAAANSEIAARKSDLAANGGVCLIDSVDLVEAAFALHRAHHRNSLRRDALARNPWGAVWVEHTERRRIRQIEGETVERFRLAADEPQWLRGGGAPSIGDRVRGKPVARVLVGPAQVMDGQGDHRRCDHGGDRQRERSAEDA